MATVAWLGSVTLCGCCGGVTLFCAGMHVVSVPVRRPVEGAVVAKYMIGVGTPCTVVLYLEPCELKLVLKNLPAAGGEFNAGEAWEGWAKLRWFCGDLGEPWWGGVRNSGVLASFMLGRLCGLDRCWRGESVSDVVHCVAAGLLALHVVHGDVGPMLECLPAWVSWRHVLRMLWSGMKCLGVAVPLEVHAACLGPDTKPGAERLTLSGVLELARRVDRRMNVLRGRLWALVQVLSEVPRAWDDQLRGVVRVARDVCLDGVDRRRWDGVGVMCADVGRVPRAGGWGAAFNHGSRVRF